MLFIIFHNKMSSVAYVMSALIISISNNTQCSIMRLMVTVEHWCVNGIETRLCWTDNLTVWKAFLAGQSNSKPSFLQQKSQMTGEWGSNSLVGQWSSHFVRLVSCSWHGWSMDIAVMKTIWAHGAHTLGRDSGVGLIPPETLPWHDMILCKIWSLAVSDFWLLFSGTQQAGGHADWHATGL